MGKKATAKAGKHAGGRPPKYATEAEMVEQIVAYTKKCDDTHQMPNKAGLCIWLGISRETYNEYKKKFPDAIKVAEAWIENAWVQRLASNAPTGAIFYLKNAFHSDYSDRKEVELSGSIKHGEMEKLSNDELESIATGGKA